MCSKLHWKCSSVSKTLVLYIIIESRGRFFFQASRFLFLFHITWLELRKKKPYFLVSQSWPRFLWNEFHFISHTHTVSLAFSLYASSSFRFNSLRAGVGGQFSKVMNTKNSILQFPLYRCMSQRERERERCKCICVCVVVVREEFRVLSLHPALLLTLYVGSLQYSPDTVFRLLPLHLNVLSIRWKHSPRSSKKK